MAEQSQGEVGKATEAITPILDAKPESLTEESEGKKWANIIRQKGAGKLYGKIWKGWGYSQPDGNWRSLDDDADMEFHSGGEFGVTNEELPALWNTFVGAGVLASKVYTSHEPNPRTNYLMAIKPDQRLKKFANGVGFSYISWLDPNTHPGTAGYPTAFRFDFILPSTQADELIRALRVDRLVLIEDIFQNVFPGLVGEKGVKRLIVDKLTFQDCLRQQPSVPNTYSFSHPIGETPWKATYPYHPNKK